MEELKWGGQWMWRQEWALETSGMEETQEGWSGTFWE